MKDDIITHIAPAEKSVHIVPTAKWQILNYALTHKKEFPHIIAPYQKAGEEYLTFKKTSLLIAQCAGDVVKTGNIEPFQKFAELVIKNTDPLERHKIEQQTTNIQSRLLKNKF